jgi:hypothetical protein
MELMPWRSFGEFGSIRSEMDRLRNKFLGETPFVRRFKEETKKKEIEIKAQK